MIYADDIRRTILTMAEERGTENTFDSSDVARKMDKENWHLLMHQVRFVADVLTVEGKISMDQSNGSVKYKKI